MQVEQHEDSMGWSPQSCCYSFLYQWWNWTVNLNVCRRVRFVLYAEGRTAINRNDIWMEPDAIMRTVATPSVYFKKEQFYFRLEKSERRYACHVPRVVLMFLPACVYHCTSTIQLHFLLWLKGWMMQSKSWLAAFSRISRLKMMEQILEQDASMLYLSARSEQHCNSSELTPNFENTKSTTYSKEMKEGNVKYSKIESINRIWKNSFTSVRILKRAPN